MRRAEMRVSADGSASPGACGSRDVAGHATARGRTSRLAPRIQPELNSVINPSEMSEHAYHD
jgi:hypothetical protein